MVLDSFAGGGTTGVAAYKKNRSCISIEKEAGFINTIRKRQEKAKNKKGY
ncbi:MAG: DNA methyltransferase [Halarcobacter sp.]